MRLSGRIVTPAGVVGGSVVFDRRILEVVPGPAEPRWILPGFVDLHVHGGGGGDTMDGEESLRVACRLHLRHGTTALLATTVTAPLEEIEAALAGARKVAAEPGDGEARVLGVHLEGPFISAERLGAQPPFSRPPDARLIERLLALAPIKVATVAPEIGEAEELLLPFLRDGVRVQIGHTAATYQQAAAALARGASGFTHLFNAMSGWHHRAPGAAGAALALAEYAELVPDLLHLDEGAIRAAFRAIPRLYCVTDAVAAAGMPDGTYRLGRRTVQKRGEGVYLEDSTLAGSTLTMDRALRNLVGLGIDPADAARRLSTYPADYLGMDELGRIVPGARADLVVLDEGLRVQEVFMGGRPVAL